MWYQQPQYHLSYKSQWYKRKRPEKKSIVWMITQISHRPLEQTILLLYPQSSHPPLDAQATQVVHEHKDSVHPNLIRVLTSYQTSRFSNYALWNSPSGIKKISDFLCFLDFLLSYNSLTPDWPAEIVSLGTCLSGGYSALLQTRFYSTEPEGGWATIPIGELFLFFCLKFPQAKSL
jgi:hypothetical protein